MSVITFRDSEGVSVTHADYYITTGMFNVTTADSVHALASQCVDPRNTDSGR